MKTGYLAILALLPLSLAACDSVERKHHSKFKKECFRDVGKLQPVDAKRDHWKCFLPDGSIRQTTDK